MAYDDTQGPGPTTKGDGLGRELRVEDMRVADALRWAIRALSVGDNPTPRLDAEMLLAHVLGAERPQVLVRWHEVLDPEQARTFEALVRRRAHHEPVAYLVGRRHFYDVELLVDERVLVPRPETEGLVDQALAWADTRPLDRLRVADVGTGSGALAIVLARRLEHSLVWAIDLSRGALEVAGANVRRYGLGGRVSLVQGDLLSAMAGPLDLIVVNPPYVPSERWALLPADVAHYEPRLALDGGPAGTVLIERLLRFAPAVLGWPGLLLMEIDEEQGELVPAMARRAFPEARVDLLPDYGGLARIVRVERPA